MPISVTGGASTASSGGGGIEPAIAVASRAGAGEATAGFGCTGTGTTTTVDGGAWVASLPAAGVTSEGGASVGAPAPAASAVDAAKGTKAVRRERVWAQRAIVFIEEIRRCIPGRRSPIAWVGRLSFRWSDLDVRRSP